MEQFEGREDVGKLLDILAIAKWKKFLNIYRHELDTVNRLKRPVSEKEPLVVSFVGKFKTGKSSLINAILGMDLLPTRATTATAVVTRIFKGKEFKVWISENGDRHPVTLAYAQNVILNYQIGDLRHPAEVIFEIPVPWLQEDIELRDTPGMDDSSQDGMLEAVALNALNDTDLCVCVYDAGAMISGAEKERTWKIHKRMGGNVVYAVNCTNRLNSIEHLNEVENLCQNFFGSMDSSMTSVTGMGKYYMMCSAPGMIELDGFDDWLKNLFSAKSIMERQKIRDATVSAQIRDKRIEISESAKFEIESLQNLRGKLCNIQEEAKKTKIKEAKVRGEEQAAKIRGIVDEAEKILINTENLRGEIVPLRSDKGLSGTSSREIEQFFDDEDLSDKYYSSKTKIAVRQYFEKNFADIRKRWNAYFMDGDETFVGNVTEAANFPGPHVAYVPATSGEKWGWAGAGAGIGALLGGPIGAAIGGAIGRAIGGSDTTTDDSVDNTMSFVQSNIIPQIKVAFESLVNKAAERARKIIVSDAENEAVGYEGYIEEADQLLAGLKKFVIK